MRTYDLNFKQEAIKLAKEIGSTKAAKELNIPSGTMDTWIYKAKTGKLTGKAPTSQNATTLAEENKELKQINEILSKATAFSFRVDYQSEVCTLSSCAIQYYPCGYFSFPRACALMVFAFFQHPIPPKTCISLTVDLPLLWTLNGLPS